LRSGQTYEFLLLASVLNLDIRLAVLVDYLEGGVPDIALRFEIGESTADETLDIEDTGEAISDSIDRIVRR